MTISVAVNRHAGDPCMLGLEGRESRGVQRRGGKGDEITQVMGQGLRRPAPQSQAQTLTVAFGVRKATEW